MAMAQPSQPGMATVRFLVISDTHDFDYFAKDTEQPLRHGHGPTNVDVLLHCGDLTTNGSPDQLERAFRALGSIDAELKLAIAGNHEATLDTAFFTSQGGHASESAAVQSLTTKLCEKHGVQLLEEGTYDFTLSSGAHFSIYASPYTPEYGSSAFQHDTSHDRFNQPEHVLPWATSVGTETSIIHKGTDIVMTHGPPKYILDQTEDNASGGCEHLRRAICQVRPKMHCFGHIHGGYGIQRVRWPGVATVDSDPRERKAKKSHGLQCEMELLAAEFVGKNQAKKRGFAALGRPSVEDFLKSKTQTVFVNAAIMDTAGRPRNAPWLLELQLHTGRAQNQPEK